MSFNPVDVGYWSSAQQCEALAEIESLRLQLTAAQKDADRYQFIRDEENFVDEEGGLSRPWETLGESSGKTFDSIVDSYIESMKGK